MVSEALLSFSLTPVQRFIEAARTVRDLKAGSKLLSHLTWQALVAAAGAGGKAMFPAVSFDEGEPDSIPNLFLMRFDGLTDAEAGATAARKSVTCRWLSLSETVRSELANQWGHGWDADWDAQIGNYWTITTTILGSADATAVYAELAGNAPPTAATDLGVQFTAISGLLAARKMVRHFPADHGVGRHKCSMMGDLEQMGPVGLREADVFWQEAAGTVIPPASIREHDRLCAVSLVKRFCHCDPRLTGLAGEIPETAEVAAKQWWRLANEIAPDKVHRFTRAYREVEDAETKWRCLLLDRLTPETVCPDNPGLYIAALREAQGKLLSGVKETLGAPPRYYGIIALDGDHMGKWLSGEKRGGRVDLDFWQSMSEQLREYASGAAGVIHEHGGYPVYAGGDDVLALAPLATALPLAQDLRETFPQFDEHSGPSSASAGLAIVHYQHDLRAGLRAARNAERAAKHPDDEDLKPYRYAAEQAAHAAKLEGRDALGIALVKRSGGDVKLVIKWDQVPDLMKLQQLFAAGLSDRWLYKLAKMLPELHIELDADALTAIVKHSLKRVEIKSSQRAGLAAELGKPHETEAEEVKEALRAHVEGQFAKWQGRVPGLPGLKRFIDFGMIASFLHRGRD